MREFFRANKRPLTLLFTVILVLSLLPVYEVVHYLGDRFQGIPPSYIDDNYYYVRMKEVVDGHPFLGNPYFIEHNDEIAPAFVFPDWLYALPMLLGFSLFTSVSIDFSFWALVFGLLVYLFFRSQQLSKRWSTLGTVVAFTQVYLLILRPVSMQIVFPFFLLFILALYVWSRDPKKKTSVVFLTLTSALTFYDYGYLWQIIVVELMLVFCYAIYKKNKTQFISLVKVCAALAVLIVPFVLFTLNQLHHPFYWETMVRTGLVYTHLPTAMVFMTGSWVLFLVLLSTLSVKWVAALRAQRSYVRFTKIHSSLGAAMVIVSGSNIITGKELETAQHVGRFIVLWLIIGTFVTLYYLVKARPEVLPLGFKKKFVLALLSFLVLIGNISYAGDLLTFTHPKERILAMTRAQAYISALTWLEQAEALPQVIWVSPYSTLTSMLPTYTKHYLLYANGGILHLVSDGEVEERFLLASTQGEVTTAYINEGVRNFAGVSYMFHIANTQNRKVKLCRLMHLESFGISCGSTTDATTLNHDLVREMYERYMSDIKPNQLEELKKFHVAYIMKDKEEDISFTPETLDNIAKVYEDERFVIYKLLP